MKEDEPMKEYMFVRYSGIAYLRLKSEELARKEGELDPSCFVVKRMNGTEIYRRPKREWEK